MVAGYCCAQTVAGRQMGINRRLGPGCDWKCHAAALSNCETPHPAFGHPLPIGWGEGSANSVLVSSVNLDGHSNSPARRQRSQYCAALSVPLHASRCAGLQFCLCRRLQFVEFWPQFRFRLPVHTVNEQDALEVIALVLHGAGKQAAATK